MGAVGRGDGSEIPGLSIKRTGGLKALPCRALFAPGAFYWIFGYVSRMGVFGSPVSTSLVGRKSRRRWQPHIPMGGVMSRHYGSLAFAST